MGVYVRADSRYYWLCLERRGQRPIRESTRIPVAAESPVLAQQQRDLAQTVYLARMGDLARARYALPQTKPSRSFRQHADWYSETISVTKRGVIRDRSMLRQLVAHFGDAPLDALDLDALRAWRRVRATQVRASTVNREIDVLRHLLGTAVPKYLDTNPALGLDDLRAEDFEARLLTRDEERRLLDVLPPEDYAIIVCALDTLMRLTNVVAMRRAQDHGTHFSVLNPKGGKAYKVPISTRLRAALDALGTTGLWCYPTYGPVEDVARRKRVADMLEAACGRAQVPYGRKIGGVTFHSLRHTGASRMIERGVNLRVVQRLGGWADLTVLERYLHPTAEDMRRAVEVVGEGD